MSKSFMGLTALLTLTLTEAIRRMVAGVMRSGPVSRGRIEHSAGLVLQNS